MLLRDPSDDNVIPVVEELRRRLPVLNAHHGELNGQHDVETGEEDGMILSPKRDLIVFLHYLVF